MSDITEITQNGVPLTLEDVMKKLMTTFGVELGHVLRQVVTEEISKIGLMPK